MPLAIVRQDITRLKVDAIVNAANTDLQMGGGVCGAIFEAVGPKRLQGACNKVAPIKTGGVAITLGADLFRRAPMGVLRRWRREFSRQAVQ